MNVTITLGDLVAQTGRQVYEHLDLADPIPVESGIHLQGDCNIIPVDIARRNGATVPKNAVWQDVPPAGIAVISGNHDHVLTAEAGVCRWTTDVSDTTGLAVGALECSDTAYMLHQEHGGRGIAAGRYIVRGTREQAEQVRRVQD